MSLARQNYHAESEAAINRQITIEMQASYTYLAMAMHFDRDDVALKGFHKFFKKQSDDERKHAEQFMKYQNDRGGRIALEDIAKPQNTEWTCVGAMEESLAMEKRVNEALLELQATASKHNDPHLCDFIEEHFLEEQVESIKQFADYVSMLRRVGPGLGEYMFDRETLDDE